MLTKHIRVKNKYFFLWKKINEFWQIGYWDTLVLDLFYKTLKKKGNQKYFEDYLMNWNTSIWNEYP